MVRVHVTGTLDGSRAMELMSSVRDLRGAETVIDFADVSSFEAFGVEVLLQQLSALAGAGGTVRCCGVPPCVADRLSEMGIATSAVSRHPRWAPWRP